MGKKLTNIKYQGKSQSPITNVKKQPFKIAIENLKEKEIKSFDRFINETVGKNLSISDVDNQYLRKRGPKNTIEVDGIEYELIHLGKSNKSFRIFGYYKGEYFILNKIDPKHKTHS